MTLHGADILQVLDHWARLICCSRQHTKHFKRKHYILYGLNFVFFFRFVGPTNQSENGTLVPKIQADGAPHKGEFCDVALVMAHEPCGGGAVLNLLRLPGCIRNITKNTHVNNFSQVAFSSLPSPPQLHTD